MSDHTLTGPDHLRTARDLVAAVVPDDIADAGPTEDLRDYGLDSIRLGDVIGRIREAGGQVGFADLAGGPTLARLAEGLAATSAARAPHLHDSPQTHEEN